MVPGLLASANGLCVSVRYEELITDPNAVLEQIGGELALDQAPSGLVPEPFRIGSYTASQHSLVSRSPIAARAMAWKDELSFDQIRLFEARAGSTLEHLGYELVAPPGFVSGRDRLKDEIQSFALSTLGGTGRRVARRTRHGWQIRGRAGRA